MQYILQLIKPIIDGKTKSFEVTDAAADEYDDWLQGRLSTRVWNDCSSYYRQGMNGKNVVTYPGPALLFWWKARKPRWDHFLGVGAERWAREKKLKRVGKLTVTVLLAFAGICYMLKG